MIKFSKFANCIIIIKAQLMTQWFIFVTDIPECSVDKGGCDHICTEKPGSYECKCNPGYKLGADQHACESM